LSAINEVTAWENTAEGQLLKTLAKGSIPAIWDDIILLYAGSNLTSVEWKLDGTSLKLLTLTYTGSRLDRVQG